MKFKKSEALNEYQSLEALAAVINEGGTSDYTPNQLAAQYIVDCCEDQENTSIENLEANLSILVDAGANSVDWYTVMEIAHIIIDD